MKVFLYVALILAAITVVSMAPTEDGTEVVESECNIPYGRFAIIMIIIIIMKYLFIKRKPLVPPELGVPYRKRE